MRGKGEGRGFGLALGTCFLLEDGAQGVGVSFSGAKVGIGHPPIRSPGTVGCGLP